jgi:tetratricopeptide (TPR) repeat protein
VLKDDPKNETAIAYLASLYLNEKRWDDANAWYDKLTHRESQERGRLLQQGLHRLVGMVSGRRHRPRQPGMKLEDPGPIKDKKVREELKAKYSRRYPGRPRQLDKALQVDPDYDDAMAYENLLIRERADLADNKEEYEKDIKTANDWVDKAMAVKKKKTEAKQKTGGGIVADPNAK